MPSLHVPTQSFYPTWAQLSLTTIPGHCDVSPGRLQSAQDTQQLPGLEHPHTEQKLEEDAPQYSPGCEPPDVASSPKAMKIPDNLELVSITLSFLLVNWLVDKRPIAGFDGQ